MRIILVIAIAVVVLLALLSSGVSYSSLAILAFLAGLMSPAVAFVVARRYSASRAFGLGTLASYGVIALVFLFLTAVRALSGDFEPTESCEMFCPPASVGIAIFVILVLIYAIPVAVVGGLISTLASVAFVRPTRSEQL